VSRLPFFCASAATGPTFRRLLRGRLAPGEVLVDGLGRQHRYRPRTNRRNRARARRCAAETAAARPRCDVLAAVVTVWPASTRCRPQETRASPRSAHRAQKDAVALVLGRIAAGHHIDQQSPPKADRALRSCAPRPSAIAAGAPPPSSATARSTARGRRPPKSLAGAAGRQQQRNSRVGPPPARSGADSSDDFAAALAGAEIASVAMGRQEPQDIGV